MQLLALTTELLGELVTLLTVNRPDDTPEPEDVKAGWTAFGIFLLLALAVVGLGIGLTKQLKRTESNRRAGAFGPVDDEAERGPGTGTDNGGEPGATPRP